MSTTMLPCDWPVSYAACGPCPTLEADSDDQETFEAMAAAYLWNWTGRSLGLCTVSIRPCRSDCATFGETFWGRGPFSQGYARDHSGGMFWGPALIGGQWFNITCGRCGGDACTCDGADSLALPGPIDAVSEVLVDGTVLAAENYRVDNHSLLVRLDAPWPTCQDLGSAPDEPGTWQVTYDRGTPVPMGGQIAAGVLACELAKAACHDATCQLPQRIQSITRQGVTVAVLDAFDDVSKGRTGIWLIDSWVASMSGPPRAGRVYSVDIARPRQRTQTWPTT